MPTTRRDLLSGIACGAGAGAVSSLLPLRARAQADAAAGLEARIRADLEQHAAFGPKFSGGPGDVATAGWISGRLRDAGYRVEESAADMPFFIERSARLEVGPVSAPVVPQAPVVTTGSAGVTASLALAEGEVGDVRGRIAVLMTPFGRHAALFPNRGIGQTVTQIAEAGARAIVIVTNGPSGEAVALNAPEEPFVPVPTAVLAPKHAEPLVGAARSGAEATLVLDGEATHRPSPNIVAHIERGERWIVMSTPRSGWYDCVAERGTGTAAFLEIADWAVQRFPNHSVWLMNTGGHEYFFAGSHRVVDQAPPPEDTLVWAHVGATLAARGTEERNGRLVMLDIADPGRTLMASDAARDAAAEAFSGLSGLSTPTAIRPGAGELSAFTDRGYETAFAVLGLHAWFHTVEDTLERADAGLVVPVLRAHQRAIELLADA